MFYSLHIFIHKMTSFCYLGIFILLSILNLPTGQLSVGILTVKEDNRVPHQICQSQRFSIFGSQGNPQRVCTSSTVLSHQHISKIITGARLDLHLEVRCLHVQQLNTVIRSLQLNKRYNKLSQRAVTETYINFKRKHFCALFISWNTLLQFQLSNWFSTSRGHHSIWTHILLRVA